MDTITKTETIPTTVAPATAGAVAGAPAEPSATAPAPATAGAGAEPPTRPGAARAAMPPDDRIRFLSKLVVLDPQAEAVLAAMRKAYDDQQIDGEPYCVFVAGRSGCGKTTLAKAFAEPYERRVEGSRVVVPVLRVTLPSPANHQSVATRILLALGDPLDARGSFATVTARLHKMLLGAGVRVLVLDEFHHLRDSNTHHVLRNATEWLKTLMIETGIAIVAFGRPEAAVVFDYNDQLQRRFGRRVALTRFGFSTPSDVKRFRSFLAFVDAELPLPESSHLAELDTAARLYYLSDGVMDYLMKVVRGATRAAIEAGLPRIDADLMARAFDEYVAGSRPDKRNPFGHPGFNVLWAREADQQAGTWADPLAQSRTGLPTTGRRR
jgi:hypothetical protein